MIPLPCVVVDDVPQHLGNPVDEHELASKDKVAGAKVDDECADQRGAYAVGDRAHFLSCLMRSMTCMGVQ